MALAIQCEMGGAIWTQQFLSGFELVGKLSRRFCYPGDSKASLTKPCHPSKLLNSDADRFSDRASKSGRENAHLLWAEALGRQEKGRAPYHFPLATTGEPFTLTDSPINIACRF